MNIIGRDALDQKFKHRNKEFEPFISHIRFPTYRNLEPDLKLEFLYPITALVGENGTNKSSIIRALFGAPADNSPGTFWFSTSLDPIEEEGGSPNCLIYGYHNKHEGKIVEVLKTRSKYDKAVAGQNPDYWEPSRPIVKYGMERMPPIKLGAPIPEGRSKTRYNAIAKKVTLLDFRTELSAYDKFFYHGDFLKTEKIKTKQDFIRHKSTHLHAAIEEKSASYLYYGRDKIEEKLNRELNKDEVELVSYVLGRTYKKIEIIAHTFFKNSGKTVRLSHSDIRYSEAFAGSGEFAVVMLVLGVLQAPPNSLILLDEPEVSLHPGAQERLMKLIISEVAKNNHQVVLSTHSPAIIRHLPPNAIKTLRLNENTGKVALVSQSLSPDDAFYYIGEPSASKLTIIVEDKLAKSIVERALKSLGPHVEKYEVMYIPGGAETLWATYIPIFSIADRKDILFLLDGDKRKPPLRKSSSIPEAENEDLGEEIKRLTGCKVDFKVDGNSKSGGNKAQLHAMQRQFIDWTSQYVDFLPMNTAEEFIVMNSPSFSSISKKPDAKETILDYARNKLDRSGTEVIKSEEIYIIQSIELAAISFSNADFGTIRSRIEQFNDGK